jgi:hypothetical protein
VLVKISKFYSELSLTKRHDKNQKTYTYYVLARKHPFCRYNQNFFAEVPCLIGGTLMAHLSISSHASNIMLSLSQFHTSFKIETVPPSFSLLDASSPQVAK